MAADYLNFARLAERQAARTAPIRIFEALHVIHNLRRTTRADGFGGHSEACTF